MLLTCSTDCLSVIINFLSLIDFIILEKIVLLNNTILDRYIKQYNLKMHICIKYGSLVLVNYLCKKIGKDNCIISAKNWNFSYGNLEERRLLRNNINKLNMFQYCEECKKKVKNFSI